VIVTDKELALLNALERGFPSVPTLLCYRHINKCILTKARTYMPKVIDEERSTDSVTVFRESDECAAFLAAWYHLVESETEEILNERLETLPRVHEEHHAFRFHYNFERRRMPC